MTQKLKFSTAWFLHGLALNKITFFSSWSWFVLPVKSPVHSHALAHCPQSVAIDCTWQSLRVVNASACRPSQEPPVDLVASAVAVEDYWPDLFDESQHLAHLSHVHSKRPLHWTSGSPGIVWRDCSGSRFLEYYYCCFCCCCWRCNWLVWLFSCHHWHWTCAVLDFASWLYRSMMMMTLIGLGWVTSSGIGVDLDVSNYRVCHIRKL